MKILLHFGFTFGLIVSCLYAGAPHIGEQIGYRNLEKTDAEAARVVQRMESFEIRGVAIIGEDVIDALEALRIKAVGDKRAGVINYLIRGSLDGQKVTIKADKIIYAKAIDEICRQTGRVWTIEFIDRLGGPSLVIKQATKQDKGQQAGTWQPATRPVDKPKGGDKPQPEAEGRCP